MAAQSSIDECKRHQDAIGKGTFRRLHAVIPALLVLAVGHFVTNYFALRQQAFGKKTSLSQVFAKHAIEIVLSRRKAYKDAGQLSTFYQRGIGYLYERHDMVLLATLPSVSMGRSVVRIDNVKRPQTDCQLWTIWTRVAGPEIFAGSADAVDDGDSCHWEFTYFADTPGDYKVDVKILMYNGRAPRTSCPRKTDKEVPLSQYGFSYGFAGFRMYWPDEADEACCEVCSRTPNCRYWVNPPLSFDLPAGALRQGCELFFDKEEDALLFDAPSNRSFHVVQLNRTHVNPSSAAAIVGRLEKVMAHGPRPAVPSSGYFLSCGWSFWFSFDFPCLDIDIDDSIHVFPKRTFTIAAPDRYRSKEDARPLCRIETDERLHDPNSSRVSGRWVRESFPNNQTCPMPMEIYQKSKTYFEIMKLDGEHPRCWHRDDLSIIVRHCREFCNLPYTAGWISPLHSEKQWYGRWQPYRCELVDLTDEELQRCVDVRKIASITTAGGTLAAFFGQYLRVRLENIKMADSTAPNATHVVLNTFSFPHLLWHFNEQMLVEKIRRIPAPTEHQESYWLAGFYYSSERQPFVTVRRSELLNGLLSQHLAKNFRMLGAYDMTAAFSFDTATQRDGLHIIGPPAKMVVTKMLHYMCVDALGKQSVRPDPTGTRRGLLLNRPGTPLPSQLVRSSAITRNRTRSL